VFTIGGKTYSFSANGQIWPRSLYVQNIDFVDLKLLTCLVTVTRILEARVLMSIWLSTMWAKCYNSMVLVLMISQSGSISGSGLDFIDGYTFLERFYTVIFTSVYNHNYTHTLLCRYMTPPTDVSVSQPPPTPPRRQTKSQHLSYSSSYCGCMLLEKSNSVSLGPTYLLFQNR
jgi:hypothetical protein